MNKFDKSLKILGNKASLPDFTDAQLIKLKVICAKASVNFDNLTEENIKLIKENVKLTKRKDKYICKLKDANLEKEQIRDLLFSLMRELQRGTVSKKVKKQVNKVLKAKKK